MKYFVKNLWDFSKSNPPQFNCQREYFICPTCKVRVNVAVPTTGID